MTGQGRGPQPKADPAAVLRHDLQAHARWRGDRVDEFRALDVTGWWREPSLLARFGPSLAELFDDAPQPTVVLGPQSRGALLGALVARHLDVGLVELRPPETRDRLLALVEQWQTTPGAELCGDRSAGNWKSIWTSSSAGWTRDRSRRQAWTGRRSGS